jgi:hypothetical protein
MQISDSPKKSIQTKYFLGTGPKEYFYTLWKEAIVSPVPGTSVGGCYYSYRQNLAHDYEVAVAKAIAKTGQTVWEAFDISEYRRQNSGNPDLSLSPEEVTINFGKYAGQTVAQVEEEDFRYLLFLATKSDWQPTKVKFARVLNYIRAIYQPVAEKQEADRAKARAERDAQRADLPAFEGRVTIIGTVLSTKCVDSQFGTTIKMLVEHETGWKVWGTIPAALGCVNQTTVDQDGNKLGWTQVALSRGDIVQFDARVQKSDRDPKFGFFSRATKASLVKYHEGVLDGVKDGYPHVTVTVQLEKV